MKKKKVTLWVLACYVYFSRSLHGQTVWVSCGMSESVVMCVDVTINRRAEEEGL